MKGETMFQRAFFIIFIGIVHFSNALSFTRNIQSYPKNLQKKLIQVYQKSKKLTLAQETIILLDAPLMVSKEEAILLWKQLDTPWSLAMSSLIYQINIPGRSSKEFFIKKEREFILMHLSLSFFTRFLQFTKEQKIQVLSFLFRTEDQELRKRFTLLANPILKTSLYWEFPDELIIKLGYLGKYTSETPMHKSSQSSFEKHMKIYLENKNIFTENILIQFINKLPEKKRISCFLRLPRKLLKKHKKIMYETFSDEGKISIFLSYPDLFRTGKDDRDILSQVIKKTQNKKIIKQAMKRLVYKKLEEFIDHYFPLTYIAEQKGVIQNEVYCELQTTEEFYGKVFPQKSSLCV